VVYHINSDMHTAVSHNKVLLVSTHVSDTDKTNKTFLWLIAVYMSTDKYFNFNYNIFILVNYLLQGWNFVKEQEQKCFSG
jgi:hypothetical protein